MAKHSKVVDYLPVACEDFKISYYFSELILELARTKFREVSKCMKTCHSYASSDSNNLRAMIQCFDCSSQDTLDHWWVCDSYKELRFNKSKDSDKGICEFYQAVINKRLKPT